MKTPEACKLFLKKFSIQVSSVNLAKILKNTFVYGTPPVAASRI